MTMTLDSIKSMEAGEQMDALVAEHVMGFTDLEWKSPCCHRDEKVNLGKLNGMLYRVPPYSTRIAAAWDVVEKESLCVHPCGHATSGKPAGYWVGYPRDGHAGLVADMENPTIGLSDKAPLAICRSALINVIRRSAERTKSRGEK